MQNFEPIVHRGVESNPSDFRADHTISGLNGFMLPDYFDSLSLGQTIEIYEAVMRILDGASGKMFDLNLLLTEDAGSPAHYAFVNFLLDTAILQRNEAKHLH